MNKKIQILSTTVMVFLAVFGFEIKSSMAQKYTCVYQGTSNNVAYNDYASCAADCATPKTCTYAYECASDSKVYTSYYSCRNYCADESSCAGKSSYTCDTDGSVFSDQSGCQSSCKKTATCVGGLLDVYFKLTDVFDTSGCDDGSTYRNCSPKTCPVLADSIVQDISAAPADADNVEPYTIENGSDCNINSTWTYTWYKTKNKIFFPIECPLDGSTCSAVGDSCSVNGTCEQDCIPDTITTADINSTCKTQYIYPGCNRSPIQGKKASTTSSGADPATRCQGTWFYQRGDQCNELIKTFGTKICAVGSCEPYGNYSATYTNCKLSGISGETTQLCPCPAAKDMCIGDSCTPLGDVCLEEGTKVLGTKDCCVDTLWTPATGIDPNKVCSNLTYTEIGNCPGHTRQTNGKADCPECPTDGKSLTYEGSDPNLFCPTQHVTQTGKECCVIGASAVECTDTKIIHGTKMPSHICIPDTANMNCKDHCGQKVPENICQGECGGCSDASICADPKKLCEPCLRTGSWREVSP